MRDKYKYHLYSPRPDYGSGIPHFIDELAPSGFISLYSVTRETAEAITAAGTARGFKCIVWSERLWLDVDSYESADRVEERLNELAYEFSSFDTGGRGVHFGIIRTSPPSHLLPLQDRTWVKEHFPEADSSIYTHLHPFRLPGTIHQKTGGQKRLVGEHPGRALELPPYERIQNDGSPRDIQLSLHSNGQKSIFDQFFIQRNSEPAKAGERHPQLVRLIYALRDNGYDVNVARFWVNEVNKRFQPPKGQDEIEKALGSIYR
jgi:hypothetical protein